MTKANYFNLEFIRGLAAGIRVRKTVEQKEVVNNSWSWRMSNMLMPDGRLQTMRAQCILHESVKWRDLQKSNYVYDVFMCLQYDAFVLYMCVITIPEGFRKTFEILTFNLILSWNSLCLFSCHPYCICTCRVLNVLNIRLDLHQGIISWNNMMPKL